MNTLAITVRENPNRNNADFNAIRESYQLKLFWGMQNLSEDYLGFVPETTFTWIDDPTIAWAEQVEVVLYLDTAPEQTLELLTRKLLQRCIQIDFDTGVELLTKGRLSQYELVSFFGRPIITVTVTGEE